MHVPEEAPKTAKALADDLQRFERWLKSHFTVMLPVNVYLMETIEEVDVDPDTVQGICEVDPDKKCINIKMTWKAPRHQAIETLMHEWAHARTMWVTDRDDIHHPPEFWLDFGRMYAKFFDEGGEKVYRELD